MSNEPKKLNPDNWLQPDPAFDNSAGFTFEECLAMAMHMSGLKPGAWDYQGPEAPLVTPQEWIRKISRHTMSENIPSDIRTLFEGAKGLCP